MVTRRIGLAPPERRGAHNHALRRNMRLFDDDEVDTFIVGSGAGGRVLAPRLGRLGWAFANSYPNPRTKSPSPVKRTVTVCPSLWSTPRYAATTAVLSRQQPE